MAEYDEEWRKTTKRLINELKMEQQASHYRDTKQR